MNSTQMPPDEGGSGETDETIAGLPDHDSNSQAMLGDDQPTQKLPIKPVASQDSIARHSFHHSTLPGTDNFASQDALLPGFILGHYELTEIVGYGGFGTVWKAHDLRLNREVAVKIPRFAITSDEDRAQFAREAKVAAQLRHPNIVAVHDVDCVNGQHFIVQDFIPGQLDQYLEGWT